jgi:hypothetical protein
MLSLQRIARKATEETRTLNTGFSTAAFSTRATEETRTLNPGITKAYRHKPQRVRVCPNLSAGRRLVSDLSSARVFHSSLVFGPLATVWLHTDAREAANLSHRAKPPSYAGSFTRLGTSLDQLKRGEIMVCEGIRSEDRETTKPRVGPAYSGDA